MDGRTRRFPSQGSVLAMVIIAMYLSLGGCLSPSSPPPEITRHVLEPSRWEDAASRVAPLSNDTVTVARFSAAETCRGTAMLYSASSWKRSAYRYHRWYVALPEMVTDIFVDDLSRSQLFQAVFTDHTYEKSRYYLEGRVTDCIEYVEHGKRRAVFGFTATFIDGNEKPASRRVIFQKEYRNEELIHGGLPSDLAKAMSASMTLLSEQLISDMADHLDRGL